MSLDFLMDWGLIWLFLGQLLLILWNERALGRPTPRLWRKDAPLVSLLVPARNEEGIIGGCLRSLLAQDYPNLEVLVLDDGSSDGTVAEVRQVAGPRVRVLTGAPLPPGWTGKNWACHQLSQAAQGELLCFVDSDTTLARGTVSAAVGMMEEEGAGLVSLVPRARRGSVGGSVLLPMVPHAMFALFPMALVHRPTHPGIAVAFGPFLLLVREAYDAAGGHAARAHSIVDDVELSRAVKAAGYPVRLANGSDLVETRWYESLGDIWRGFSKNAYGGVGYNPWMAAVVVLGLMPVLLLPFFRLGLGIVGGDIPAAVLWQVALLLANRLLTSHLGRDPLWSTLFHPVMVAFWGLALAWSAMLSATHRSVVWRDREVPTRPQELP
ncbi:MAG: glycosyltransferase [Acidimicrobiia bacterium]|nr:glycosyltransferase [Acidimicrobiia bacterium]